MSEAFHSSSGGASWLLFFSCAQLPRFFLLSSPPGGAPRLLFSSCAPLPWVFLLSSPSGGASRLLFFSCAPPPRFFLLSSPPDGAPWLLFFSCAPPLGFFFSLPLLAGHHGFFSSPVPRPLDFLLSLSYDQNPVTSLDLISGHTIGLPKGCHRHIIPLSNIPQAVTLPYYINSQ